MAASFKSDEIRCCFCGQMENARFGIFFQNSLSKIYVHQYCMFFASGLPQNGRDEEGFDGFLLEDIIKEIKRTQRLKCSYCRKSGASVGCAIQRCKVNCHFICGQKFGMMHQFFGNFRSYCVKHRPFQDFCSLTYTKEHIACAICLENLNQKQRLDGFLKMPCCKDNFIHSSCLQQQALSSGYFFRCPTCNNQDLFIPEMKKFGIYIPDRDALWEDGMAYNDLLEAYSHCDSKYCHCPRGRTHFSKSGRWKILRCESCGQSAVHRHCAELIDLPKKSYVCDTCLTADNKTRYSHVIHKNTTCCSVLLKDIFVPAKNLNGCLKQVKLQNEFINYPQLNQPPKGDLDCRGSKMISTDIVMPEKNAVHAYLKGKVFSALPLKRDQCKGNHSKILHGRKFDHRGAIDLSACSSIREQALTTTKPNSSFVQSTKKSFNSVKNSSDTKHCSKEVSNSVSATSILPITLDEKNEIEKEQESNVASFTLTRGEIDNHSSFENHSVLSLGDGHKLFLDDFIDVGGIFQEVEQVKHDNTDSTRQLQQGSARCQEFSSNCQFDDSRTLFRDFLDFKCGLYKYLDSILE